MSKNIEKNDIIKINLNDIIYSEFDYQEFISNKIILLDSWLNGLQRDLPYIIDVHMLIKIYDCLESIRTYSRMFNVCYEDFSVVNNRIVDVMRHYFEEDIVMFTSMIFNKSLNFRNPVMLTNADQSTVLIKTPADTINYIYKHILELI